jgi:two-component system response regulator
MKTGPILLVEDNPDDEMLALRAFSKNGIMNPVVVARDGQEALDYLGNAANPMPEFVLLDLKLPKVAGLEVLKRIRADARTVMVPVIVLTSSLQDADLRSSYTLGANSYIRKPLDMAVFSTAIGTLARYWLEYNETPV